MRLALLRITVVATLASYGPVGPFNVCTGPRLDCLTNFAAEHSIISMSISAPSGINAPNLNNSIRSFGITDLSLCRFL